MYTLSFRLKSFHPDSLHQCETYLSSVFHFFGLSQVKRQRHPQRCTKITVCRSPHIDKKSREQFQVKTHSKTLACRVSTPVVLPLLVSVLEDIQLSGVEMELSLDYVTF